MRRRELLLLLSIAACEAPAPPERLYLNDVLVPPTSESDLCYQHCFAIDPCFGETGNMESCLLSCDDLPEECGALTEAYYTCVLEWSEDYCQSFEPCAAFYTEAQRCSFRTTSCEQGGDTCACQGTSLSSEIAAECETLPGSPGEPTVQCGCFAGDLISICQQPTLDCTLETSCCREVLDPFFTPPSQR